MLATEQSEGTKTTMNKLSQLLYYCATHPDTTVRFTASDMLLAIEGDASYLSVVKARSRGAGYFYLTDALSTPSATLKPNCTIHVLCHIMREVLSSAAEAELGALFITERNRVHYALHSKKWGIRNLQPQWPPTTIPPAALPMTCVFIGSGIAFVKVNSKSIGAKDRPIVPTTFPNITPRPIIRPSDPRTCIPPQTPPGIASTILLYDVTQPPATSDLAVARGEVCCYPRRTQRVIITASQNTVL
jgi:hypothetical protein